mmetsp:Transcript_65403/g.184647  ORF Transcript_65403/g.184647 Transcript_65403/m.184647 type:complete len:291 (-) Transcript_65403:103-975(-)
MDHAPDDAGLVSATILGRTTACELVRSPEAVHLPGPSHEGPPEGQGLLQRHQVPRGLEHRGSAGRHRQIRVPRLQQLPHLLLDSWRRNLVLLPGDREHGNRRREGGQRRAVVRPRGAGQDLALVGLGPDGAGHAADGLHDGGVTSGGRRHQEGHDAVEHGIQTLGVEKLQLLLPAIGGASSVSAHLCRDQDKACQMFGKALGKLQGRVAAVAVADQHRARGRPVPRHKALVDHLGQLRQRARLPRGLLAKLTVDERRAQGGAQAAPGRIDGIRQQDPGHRNHHDAVATQP